MSVLDQLPEFLKAPPADLSPNTTAFWWHVVATGSYDAPARMMLNTFCRTYDRLQNVAALLAKEGDIFTDKHNQPREHPAAKREIALTNELGKEFRLLGWDIAPPEGQLALPFVSAGRTAASYAPH